MQTSDENKGWLEQEAQFSNEIEMFILKLERIVVLVHQFSKLKRLLKDAMGAMMASFNNGGRIVTFVEKLAHFL